jgi:serine/threonine protein phosphatase PrpC
LYLIYVEILEFDRTENDKFLIIASDGVWEYMKNEEVMEAAIPFYEKKNAE